MLNDEILKEAKKRLRRVQDYESENRKMALDDLKHLNGDQWDSMLKKERESTFRPCLTLNRLPSFVDQVVGDQRQNRPQIKIRPADFKSNVKMAEIKGGIVRGIEHESHAEQIYDWAFEQAVSCGYGCLRLVTKYDSEHTFDQQIRLQAVVNALSVYLDPLTESINKLEMMWGFITERVPKDEFEDQYPDAVLQSVDTGRGDGDLFWYGDDYVVKAEYWKRVPIKTDIVQLSDGRVMTKEKAETLLRTQGQMDQPKTNGKLPPILPVSTPPIKIVKERTIDNFKVQQYIISGSEVLEGPNDWAGKYIPIFPVYGKEIVVDGKRYIRGVIRHAKDSQRMYNYWRTTATELVALAPKAPYLMTPQQIENHEAAWRDANRTNNPYLLYNEIPNQPRPQREPFAQTPTGVFTEAQAAIEDMKATTNIHNAALGLMGNEKSGKAIRERKMESDVANFAYIDNLSRTIRHVGVVLLDLIPKVYDTERVLRVRKENEQEEVVTVNQITKDQMGNTVIINDLSEGHDEVVVDVGPSYTTARQEAAESIIAFVQAVPQSAPVIMDLIAKSMDWPMADEIAKRLEKLLPPGILEPKQGEPPPQPPQPSPEIMLENRRLDVQLQKLQVELEGIKARGEKIDDKVKRHVMNILQELYSFDHPADKNLTGARP